MSIFTPVTRLASRSICRNLPAKRHISFKKIFASVFDNDDNRNNINLKDSITVAKSDYTNKMASIEALKIANLILKLEKQGLVDRVRELVDELEEMKKPDQIKLTPDQIIKSKKEQEAIIAIEKLELKAKAEASKTTTKTSSDQKQPAKKQEPKAAKPRGGQPAAKEPEKPLDVSRLDLRIGKIVEVGKHPDADSLYLEKIDCGDPTGPRTVISGLVNHVPIDQMQDRLVVVLCNLKPAKMRGILSEAMVMCASTPEKVELLGVPEGVKPGDRVVFERFPGEPDAQLNPKKKIWEQVAPDIKTNDEGVAMYKDCPFKASNVDGAFRSNLKNVQIR